MAKIKLTPKQLRVFQLYFQGLTQIQIKKELNCSQNYVSKTLRLVCERLGLELNQDIIRYFRMDIEKKKSFDKMWGKARQENLKELYDLIDKLNNNCSWYLTNLKDKINMFYN